MKGFLKKKGSTYFAVINVKDIDGKWKKKWISTNTGNERLAKNVLKDIIKKVEQQGTRQYLSSGMKFYELMEVWLNKVIINEVEVTTFDGYCTNVNMHIVPYFKEKKITVQKLTTLDLNEYINYEYNHGRTDGSGGISANFIRKIYYNIKKALDYAVDVLEIIDKNVANKASLPKIKKYNPTYYSVQELKKLLKVTKGTLIESVIFLAVNYGIRRGEILGLRWNDINFYDNTLEIKNQRTKVKREVEKSPKSDSSNRILPLMDHVKEYLLELKDKQKDEKRFLGKAYIESDYICRYPDGTPVNMSTLEHTFKRILRNNKMTHIRFHDIRHSTGTYLVKLGVPLNVIQQWLGHADIKTTNLYTHVDISMKVEAGEKVNDTFGDKPIGKKKREKKA